MKMPNPPPAAAGRLVKVGLLGGTAVYAAFNNLYNAEGGHRAIVFNRLEGIKDKVYPEGTHFMITWFERPIIYDVRAHPNLVESTSGSHDLQMVRIGLHVLTRPLPEKLLYTCPWGRTSMREFCLQSFMKHSKQWLPNTMPVS